MKANFVLADAASPHPDGTVSVLRGGINRVSGEAPPYPLRASMVFWLTPERGDTGHHSMTLKCLDEHGEVKTQMEGGVEVTDESKTSVIILEMGIQFKRPGSYAFVMCVDEIELARWPIEVGVSQPQVRHQVTP